MATNPFDQFDTQTKQTENPFDQFEKPKEKPKATNLERAGATAYGAATGFLGVPGEIEKFATYTAPQFLGLQKKGYQEKGPEFLGGRPTVFPTTEDIQNMGQKVGIQKPRREVKGYQDVGELLGSVGTAIPSLVRGGAALAKTGSRLLPGAMEKATGEITKIAKPTDISALGESMESSLNQSLKAAQKTSSTEYERLLNEAAQEAAGNESRVVDSFTKYIKENLINKAKDLNDPQQKLLIEAYQNIRGKSIKGIELEIRRLKDIAKETSLTPGYTAARSTKAKEAAKQLEQSVDLVTKKAKEARKAYESTIEPVNIYQSTVGKKLLEGRVDPASLPDKFFKTKYSVDQLKGVVGEADATRFANNHIANELSVETTAKAARSWYDKNKVWLKEFPQSRDATEAYIKNLEKIEKTRGRAKNVAIAGATIGGATEAYNQFKKLLNVF
jgi:hypothetical protein